MTSATPSGRQPLDADVFAHARALAASLLEILQFGDDAERAAARALNEWLYNSEGNRTP